MAKQIKFNLMVDGHGVRSMDELKENFNISDIMDHYENGTLLRWLEVREYNEYSERIKAIATSIPLEEKAKALFNVFDFPSDDENVRQAIFALVHSKQREQALKELNVNNAAADKIIENYIAGYEKLKADIKQHVYDEPFIRTALTELNNKYACLLKLNWIDVCLQFKNRLPASIEKMMENLNSVYDIDDAISITNIAYRFIKITLKANATNLTAIKRIIDKIADNFFIEFKQDYKQFYYEIKDSHPLIVYGLFMNKKIHNFLISGNSDEDIFTFYNDRKYSTKDHSIFLDDLFINFGQLHPNIHKNCLQYFKEYKRDVDSTTRTVVEESSTVLVISMPHKVELMQSSYNEKYIKRNGKRLFILVDHLNIKLNRGGTILYIKIPGMPNTTSI